MANPAKPPGKRLLKRMSTRTKWLILTPISLLLISAGLCVFSGAAHFYLAGQPFRQWFLLGMYSLILFNSGVLLFGYAQRLRTAIEYRKFVRRQLRKQQKELLKRKIPSGNRNGM